MEHIRQLRRSPGTLDKVPKGRPKARPEIKIVLLCRYIIRCYMLRKIKNDEHQKSSMGSMDGHPSNWLSIMAPKIQLIIPCLVCVTGENLSQALSKCVCSLTVMPGCRMKMVCDWSCKPRHAKVLAAQRCVQCRCRPLKCW